MKNHHSSSDKIRYCVLITFVIFTLFPLALLFIDIFFDESFLNILFGSKYIFLIGLVGALWIVLYWFVIRWCFGWCENSSTVPQVASQCGWSPDTLYYIGFITTLWMLAFAFYNKGVDININGNDQRMINNILASASMALTSTIAGIILRHIVIIYYKFDHLDENKNPKTLKPQPLNNKNNAPQGSDIPPCNDQSDILFQQCNIYSETTYSLYKVIKSGPGIGPNQKCCKS